MHVFEVATNGGTDDDETIQDTASNKRKAYRNTNEQRIKKQNSFSEQSNY